MTYVPTWSTQRHGFGYPDSERMLICSHEAKIVDGELTARFDNQGGGMSFDIPLTLTLDERKRALVEMGYYHTIDMVKRFHEQAASIGVDLPLISIVDAR